MIFLSPVPPKNAELKDILFTLDTAEEVDGNSEESFLVIDENGKVTYFECFSQLLTSSFCLKGGVKLL